MKRRFSTGRSINTIRLTGFVVGIDLDCQLPFGLVVWRHLVVWQVLLPPVDIGEWKYGLDLRQLLLSEILIQHLLDRGLELLECDYLLPIVEERRHCVQAVERFLQESKLVW